MKSHRLLSTAAASIATLLLCLSTAAQAQMSANAASRRHISADGQGNVNAVGGSGFSTAAGSTGLHTRSFNRSADGSASGQGNTTLTNANTGVTLDGNTTYTKGSGITRSVSCKDAAGNAVACGQQR
jgi:hypothetical protein